MSDDIVECLQALPHGEFGARCRDVEQRLKDACQRHALGDVHKIIESEQPISSFICAYLISRQDNEKAKRSQTNAANARKKGVIWRQAAIELYMHTGADYNSLYEFCNAIAGIPLTTMDKRGEVAPQFRTVYDHMLSARKEGKLSARVSAQPQYVNALREFLEKEKQ